MGVIKEGKGTPHADPCSAKILANLHDWFPMEMTSQFIHSCAGFHGFVVQKPRCSCHHCGLHQEGRKPQFYSTCQRHACLVSWFYVSQRFVLLLFSLFVFLVMDWQPVQGASYPVSAGISSLAVLWRWAKQSCGESELGPVPTQEVLPAGFLAASLHADRLSAVIPAGFTRKQDTAGD